MHQSERNAMQEVKSDSYYELDSELDQKYTVALPWKKCLEKKTRQLQFCIAFHSKTNQCISALQCLPCQKVQHWVMGGILCI